MAVDHGPVVQSALLRSELVALRRACGLSQYELAPALDWPPSKLISMERGRTSIGTSDLDTLLARYGVTSDTERDRLHALNRSAKGKGWWNAYRSEIAHSYLNYVAYEAGAVFIRQYPGVVMPGLLQTSEYAEAITEPTTDRRQSVIELRMQRQSELLSRSNPPRQYYVIDEAAIRRHVGVKEDPAIMPNQLRFIVEMVSASELITVRVITFEAGYRLGLSSPFTLMEFDGNLSDLLYLDTGQAERATLTGDDPEVAEYADRFESMLDLTLPEDESITFIRTAAEEMS